MAAPSENHDFITADTQVLSDIVQYLQRIGCCPRCILRFLSEKRISAYKNIDQVVSDLKSLYSEWDSDDSAKTESTEESRTPKQNIVGNGDQTEDAPCTACLGLLTKYCNQEFVDTLIYAVKTEKFEVSSFIASITIPVNLMTRHHAILVALREKWSDVYNVTKFRDELPQAKDVWKWVNGPGIGSLLGVPFLAKDAMFDICVTFTHPGSEKECNFLTSLCPEHFTKRKVKKESIFNRTNVLKALQEIPDSVFRKYCQCPPKNPVESCQYDIKCTHEVVFLAGRYNKYSRELSQTPWFINGKRKQPSSVEEKISDTIKTNYCSNETKFSSSGREDVDVQTLGRGRPFLVEILNPHRVVHSKDDIRNMQKKINTNANGEVRVRDLQVVTREESGKLKEGEDEKTKTYSALCWAEKIINEDDMNRIKSQNELKIYQKTPIRVLHRRNLASRERIIHNIGCTLIDDHLFNLHLTTQAGTYIKEFVHSDFGRTKPSMVTLLGCVCDILELNVESVNLDWPPALEDDDDTSVLQESDEAS